MGSYALDCSRCWLTHSGGVRHSKSLDESIADRVASACPQYGPPGVTKISQFIIPQNISEDCLFVNVWTKPQTGEKKKAVVLWLYGGGFNMGDSNSSNTNGAAMAYNQDIVVVSINYRINVFGFPGAPALIDQNPGLLDQRLGVEWVRDNIAAFGGDPMRLTLYGESAGGGAVDYYSYAWTKDPIVVGFIPSSGNALIGMERLNPSATPNKNWYDLSTKLGCGGAGAGLAGVTCVQSKLMKAVADAMPITGGLPPTASGGKGIPGTAGLRGGFGPLADDRTVFRDVFARAKSGNFIKKA
jgi:cholinesterase